LENDPLFAHKHAHASTLHHQPATRRAISVRHRRHQPQSDREICIDLETQFGASLSKGTRKHVVASPLSDQAPRCREKINKPHDAAKNRILFFQALSHYATSAAVSPCQARWAGIQ
jgi:hypothetical protein